MYTSQGFRPFPRSTPEEQGTPPAAVQEFSDALLRVAGHIRGFCLVQNGKAIAEEYRQPYESGDRVWVYSISKSFAPTAVGIAIGEGLLALDDAVLSFFPESAPPAPTENLRAMRVRDLLCMSTGHAQDTTLPLLSSPDGDWIKTFLSLPVEHAPGTHFLYNNGATFMLSAIVQKTAGEKLLDYLAPRLFEPLGFDNVEWDENPRGINTGGWGISLRLEDLAKLGQLYLDKGLHGGRRILPPQWAETATSFHSDNSKAENQAPDWTRGYGFQFWLCQHGAFRADGAAGQFCVVMPQQNAVLAIMSETMQMQSILDAVWGALLPRLGKMKLAPRAESGISGRAYRMDGNAFGIQRAAFVFGKDSIKLEFSGASAPCALEAGRGEWLAGETAMPLGFRAIIPMFAQAGRPKRISAWSCWLAPDTLEIIWAYRDTPHRDRLVCIFSGGRVEILCPPSDAALFKKQGAARLCGAMEAPL
ncbi:MAG: beta-lactamase family protein [Clostridiales bacterium]|jgi:CubicO group peptidase (beta-lactamase class C family)|nr:beta-lactamase family protein [Clostridiales bacterium]